MVTESKERLEQIAREIEWPEELSPFILSLNDNLSENEKLDALTISLSNDSFELLDKYFKGFSDKDSGQLLEYARQQDWSVEKKVQISAVNGIDYIWFLVERGLNAAAWGSAWLNEDPLTVYFDASRYQRNKSDGSQLLSVIERRKLGLANDITGEYDWLETTHDSPRRNEFAIYINDLKGHAALWEDNPTGIPFVNRIAQELRDEPIPRKTADRNLPFTIGKIFGAEKARDLYIARYGVLR